MSLKAISLRLRRLSFRTGVIILAMCVPFYILSFAQALLPISVAAKGVLWAVLFGMAKTCQYGGLTILGVDGYKKLKAKLKRKKTARRRVFIFDFDGTLADTRQLITRTMRQTLRELGLPDRTDDECAATIGLPLVECFRTLLQTDDETARRCADTYRRIFETNNTEGTVSAFPHVVETVRRLHAEGNTLTIASSRRHESIVALLNGLAIADCFALIIGADDVTEAKPKPEPVLKTLAAIGADAAEAVVIGDTAYDIIMGREAGVETVGVTWGNGTAEELEAAGATRVISDIRELA